MSRDIVRDWRRHSNQSDVMLAASPQSIAAPNLLVVGAATADGHMTSFRTYGDSVKLYAWGEGVPVRTPGEGRSHGKGTSEAAPLVVRAAVQMLAANPRLRQRNSCKDWAKMLQEGKMG